MLFYAVSRTCILSTVLYEYMMMMMMLLQHVYVLRAVLLHSGVTSTTGHYVVHKLHNDTWYCYNDAQVTTNTSNFLLRVTWDDV